MYHSHLQSSASIHHSAYLHHNWVHSLAIKALRAEKEFEAQYPAEVTMPYCTAFTGHLDSTSSSLNMKFNCTAEGG
jgi:hypothetical protein